MQRSAVFLLVVALAVGLGMLILSRQDELSGPEGARVPEVHDRVRVEVLNAAGVPRLARLATERLRRSGFDVVYFGNAGTFGADSTRVLDRVGRLADAERVADALQVERFASEPDSSLYVDVTVLLGKDWAERADSVALFAVPR